MKKLFLYLSSMFIPTIALLLVTTQVVEAACAVARRTYSSPTYWAFCNVPSSFQSKVSTAISIWDAAETYTYSGPYFACSYAYSWGYESFTSKGWGTNPGTTFISWSGSQVSGAISYFNSNKSWFNSTCDGCSWSPGWFDRGTVALHETGHWMYLEHPSSCGQNHPEAVMEPTTVTKTYLRSDDLYGLQLLGVR